MDNYVCKIATLDEMNKKWDYEINNAVDDKSNWIIWKELHITNFNKKMVTIPSYMAKGLEFDSVIIYTEINNKYTENEKNLYYVSCTRAQHELIIYNQ